MRITKFGHSCILIEEHGLRIITDPSKFSTGQDSAEDIGLILITHKDIDHFSLDSVKKIIANNPGVRIVTNDSVGTALGSENIAYEAVEDRQSLEIGGISIEGFGEIHALMHASIPQQQNTGYLIADKLFFPGDAFTLPDKPIDILALPVEAPWLKLAEVVDYAYSVKPEFCFPIHDGLSGTGGFIGMMISGLLKPAGIKYVNLEIGKETEF